MNITCCHHCTERHPACHDSCEKYIHEKEKRDEYLKKYYSWNAFNSVRKYDQTAMSPLNRLLYKSPHRRG